MSAFVARFSGYCKRCRKEYAFGTLIEREDGGYVHAAACEDGFSLKPNEVVCPDCFTVKPCMCDD